MGEQAAVRRMPMRGLASLLHGGSSMALASCWASKGQSGWPCQGRLLCLFMSPASWGRGKARDRPKKAGKRATLMENASPHLFLLASR